MTQHTRSIIAVGLIVTAISLNHRTQACSEEVFRRHLYPLAASVAKETPNFVLDVSEVADSTAAVRWAEESKSLCEEWFPILCRFLTTDDWTRPKEIKLIVKKDLKANGQSCRRRR